MIAPILLNAWEGGTPAGVFSDFDGDRWSSYREEGAIPVEEKPEYQGVEILLASYGQGSYEGDAFVLFRRDGKLYEVSGGHCSCYGLEGQWEPEETTVDALRYRVEHGSLGADNYCGNEFAPDLTKLLDALSSE
jgi:hypothetical protein